jgi:hypothetical protein
MVLATVPTSIDEADNGGNKRVENWHNTDPHWHQSHVCFELFLLYMLPNESDSTSDNHRDVKCLGSLANSGSADAQRRLSATSEGGATRTVLHLRYEPQKKLDETSQQLRMSVHLYATVL